MMSTERFSLWRCNALAIPLMLILTAAMSLQAAPEVTPPASPLLDAAKAPVRLASLDWGPYVGRELVGHGYAAELVKAAFAERGYRVEIEYLPWARALHDARRGAFEGIFPEYFGTAREQDFIFSDAFPGGPVGLYKRRGDRIAFAADPARHLETALRSIARHRIGVVRGYLNSPVFDAAEYLHKTEAVDDAANLRKLIYGRVDLIFIDFRVARFLLDRQFTRQADEVEPLLPAIENKLLYIAFSRHAARGEVLRQAFNGGLEVLRSNGELERIGARHALRD